jgi:hypothetical protein
MIIKRLPAEKTGLEKAIDEILREMETLNADDDAYATMVDQLTKLHKLKECEKPSQVSKDTWAIVGGHVLGIALIVFYEKSNVVTSKALNLLFKLR